MLHYSLDITPGTLVRKVEQFNIETDTECMKRTR